MRRVANTFPLKSIFLFAWRHSIAAIGGIIYKALPRDIVKYVFCHLVQAAGQKREVVKLGSISISGVSYNRARRFIIDRQPAGEDRKER